ncbi:transporter substrate-binding domain-containing protein [Pseudoduganella sp. LjRoot289]|uniref:substrate-binding periplasmic protein n=1 Tax=Pseudoduganella sp. LjRoot289 TaxID=3342314 RepID=UPI003ED164D9
MPLPSCLVSPFPALRLLVLAALLCARLACAQAPQEAQQEVQAYNTYLHAPFLNEDGSGIAAELVACLNAHMSGVKLHLNNISRRRLLLAQMRDAAAFEGVGLLLSPAFVNEDKQPRFLWSDPIFQDYNVLIFAGAAAPAVASVADLKGKRFGAVVGNRYLYMEEQVAAGSIMRHDTNGERLNLRKVANGRLEFTQMNRLLYGAMSAEPEFAGKLVAISEPGMPPFSRRIFVGPHHPEWMAKLNEALAALPCDRRWRATAGRHGIALAPCAGH